MHDFLHLIRCMLDKGTGLQSCARTAKNSRCGAHVDED